MTEFYMTFARKKVFFSECWGHLLSCIPICYAYEAYTGVYAVNNCVVPSDYAGDSGVYITDVNSDQLSSAAAVTELAYIFVDCFTPSLCVHVNAQVVAMATEHPKVPAEIESGIQNFDHGKLKHAETSEKNPLPSSDSQYRSLPLLLLLLLLLLSKRLTWYLARKLQGHVTNKKRKQ